MKKICSVIMAILLCFSVFSCEQKTEETYNSIQLTLDNCSKYLEYSSGFGSSDFVSFYVTESSKKSPIFPDDYTYDSGAKAFHLTVDVESISSHFVYNDITMKFRMGFCFKYLKYPGFFVNKKDIIYHDYYNPIYCEVVVNLDINGNGRGETYMDLRDYLVGVVDKPNDYLIDHLSQYDMTIELIEIDGTITPTF